jgi:glucose-1-phosphatase
VELPCSRPVESPPAIRAVLLDLGNVLVFHDNALLVRRLAERAGKKAEDMASLLTPQLEEDINRGRYGPGALRQAICERLGAAIPDDEFDALWSSHFSVHQEVLPLVEGLVGRVRLVLVSNTNALHLAFLRPRLPLLERFSRLVLSFEEGMVKPEPEIFHRALLAAEVEPAEAAFFDDIPRYAQAASALGIHGRVFTDARAFATQLHELGL